MNERKKCKKMSDRAAIYDYGYGLIRGSMWISDRFRAPCNSVHSFDLNRHQNTRMFS